MLIVDKPIKSKREDFLDRKDFAENISNAILNYSDADNSSLTIGLYGKWGSGKTSIINMITENLESKENIIIVQFEPWIFSDTQQLISNFFKAFAKAVKYKDYADEAKKIGEELEAYAAFFEPLGLIPEPTISFFSLASSKVFGSIGKAGKKWGEVKSKSLSDTKLSIEKHLLKLNKKILIIVDDIDRLNNTEIRQIFQMIKVLGNFPNTVYLSSMDKDIVANALFEDQKLDGSEYLEKIINVPFMVPSISNEEVQKFLFMKLDEIVKDDESFDKKYWVNVYHSGYKHFFKNIRDIVRYINVLRFNYGVLKNKVNVVDLMASTALQVFEPKIFESMKANKDLFIGSIPENRYGGDDVKEKIKSFIEESYKNLQALSKEAYLGLLEELFIKIKEVYSNTHYVGSPSKCRKDAKICSEAYFDTYFTMVLNEKELSSYEMKGYIKKIADEENFKQEILWLNEHGKITGFLDKLQDFTSTDIPKESFQSLINVLMDTGDAFPDEDEGKFSFGISMQIMRIFHQLLIRVENKKERFEILKTAMEKAENSIHIMTEDVSIHMQEHGEYDKEAEPTSQCLIEKEDLLILKEILLSKISTWIERHNLLEHENALSILYVWLRLQNEQAKDYVSKQIQDENNLLLFLKLFISYGRRQSANDYTMYTYKTYNYKDIDMFIDIETVIERVRNIHVNEDELTVYAVENFISQYNNRG
ncbi:KAP family P-loop NTPase fold protein [Sulfuricurvum sp.]|uniref:KAP family P-loop NTPase fold protein n=1 Tax=Sulfuricurvum sp. TaxID=2025608 RepID=UPI002E329074|nr:P-loop NTPase fold protein [Sulfuricurvum sp.]HEX5329792.1 P-loop NTPase fold protein [Sulfuricurvum sp.]